MLISTSLLLFYEDEYLDLRDLLIIDMEFFHSGH
jgi:hypothetical protein